MLYIYLMRKVDNFYFRNFKRKYIGVRFFVDSIISSMSKCYWRLYRKIQKELSDIKENIINDKTCD